jgi:hypothetical protein
MTEDIRAELDRLTRQHKGKLSAAQVLEFGEANRESAIGRRLFARSDRAAAKLWRLEEASRLIRAWIEYVPQIERTVRAVVSIPSDRANDAVYRRTADVLDDRAHRVQLIENALLNISRKRMEFAYLPELGPMFDRIDAILAETRRELLEAPQPRAAGPRPQRANPPQAQA